MSEEQTKDQNGARPFEERVFARFDMLDARFNNVDIRLTDLDERLQKLEAKQYDTKPIWERALTEIAALRQEVQAGFRNVDRQIGVLSKDIVQLRADVGDAVDRLHDLERKG